MKKIISLLVSFTMLLSIVSVVDFSAFADTLTTGKCGENVTYSFDESTGVLTISGTGDMSQWPEDDSPWYADTHIKTLIIDEGVTSIGARAFQSCSNLSNVQLPNSLISINSDAFCNCRSLTSVTIPDGVTDIGYSAFESCTNLTSFNVNAGNSNYSSQDGVLFNKDKTELIQYPVGNERTTYDIPNSVTSIGDYAFSKCANLSNVTIPSSVTSIGNDAFSECMNLSNVTIPNSVTSIGCDAFYGCKRLTSVTIGNGVTSIENSTFSECTSLTSVTIPDSVTNIGYFAFQDCTSLKNVTIPDSVTSIEYGAFYNCKNLVNVTIPNTLTNIGAHAFYICDNLKNVYYKGSQEEWNKLNIRDNNKDLKNATIYCNFVACTENNHNYFGDWTVAKEATCTVSGLKQRTCSYDGYTETVKIPATGHNFANNSAKCLVCGEANPNYVAPTQSAPSAKPVSKPKSAAIKKLKSAKKAIAIEWKKVSGVNGYEIQVATDKKFKKNKKTVTVKKQKTTKVTVKKLKAKKKYYVRIRTYKTVKGKKVYSSWSKVKTVKTK